MPPTVRNVTLSLPFPSIELGWEPSNKAVDKDVLRELFIFLNDRRALLYSPVGRPVHHFGYVRQSVQEIREELVSVRKRLRGDDAEQFVDLMAKACRSYLSAAEEIEATGQDLAAYNFEPALRELREFFREAAKHFRNKWNLDEAQQLVKEMYAEDKRHLDLEIERDQQPSDQ
jgi:hypothetical protein